MTGRFSIKAVLVGALVETACTYSYGFVASFAVAFTLAARGMTNESLRAHLLSVPLLVCGLVVGSASALLGGFVAARIAKARELLHAAVSAVPCMVLGAVLLSKGKFLAPPTWYTIAAFTAVIPAALVGGYLGSLRNEALAHAKRQ